MFYRPLDEEGRLSGDEIAFVYPDLKTALVGKFEGSLMISARERKIVAEKCGNGIKRIKFSEIRSEDIFKHEKMNEFRFAGTPTR